MRLRFETSSKERPVSRRARRTSETLRLPVLPTSSSSSSLSDSVRSVGRAGCLQPHRPCSLSPSRRQFLDCRRWVLSSKRSERFGEFRQCGEFGRLLDCACDYPTKRRGLCRWTARATKERRQQLGRAWHRSSRRDNGSLDGDAAGRCKPYDVGRGNSRKDSVGNLQDECADDRDGIRRTQSNAGVRQVSKRDGNEVRHVPVATATFLPCARRARSIKKPNLCVDGLAGENVDMSGKRL